MTTFLGAGGEGKLQPWKPQDMDDVKAVVHSTLDGAAKVAIQLQREVQSLPTLLMHALLAHG